jgi:hypothetical protein
VLLRLRVTLPSESASLLAVDWSASHVAGMGHASPDDKAPVAPNDRTPLVRDFSPSLAFTARVTDGELVTFSSVRAGAMSHVHVDFIERFDLAIAAATPVPVHSGIYLQAVPYLGSGSPDLTVARPNGILSELIEVPFSFRFAGDLRTTVAIGGLVEAAEQQADRHELGGAGIPAGEEETTVSPGRPVLVLAGGLMYAINAYRLEQ